MTPSSSKAGFKLGGARENLRAALALHFAWYTLVRIHLSWRVIPEMAAGVPPITCGP